MARDLPRYQWSLGLDQACRVADASAGFQLNQYGRSRTDIPGELATRQKARGLLDLYSPPPDTAAQPAPGSAKRAAGRSPAACRTPGRQRQLDAGQQRTRPDAAVLLSLEGKW
jgi:outer membrane receptor for ferrienterochelin and colicins